MATEIPVTDPSVTKLTPATITGNELIPLDDGTQAAAQAVTVENLAKYTAALGPDCSVTVRDENQRVTEYIDHGVTYSVTRNPDGTIATIDGGGKLQTWNYDGDGLFSGIVTTEI